jgi:hypothetical protein
MYPYKIAGILLLPLSLAISAAAQTTPAPAPNPAPQTPPASSSQAAPPSQPPAGQAQPAQPDKPVTHITPDQAKELFASVGQILHFASDDTKLPIKHDVKSKLTTPRR